AQTEVYPARPVRLIVAFPPGGSVDVVARLVAPRLSESLGQPVVIDNRSGASGNIGTEVAARARPDGYTLLIHTIPFVANVHLYSPMPYDALNDFVPIALLSSSPSVLVVHPTVPARSVGELLQLAKSKPGALNYSAAGAGTNPHIAGELLNMLAGVDIVAVQYKGGGPALVAVLGGEIGITFPNISEAAPHVNSKRLRALGVTSARRSAALPEVPTIAESGVPGYEFVTWHGVLAPRGTPAEIVALLNQKLRAVLRSPELSARFAQMGLDVIASSPEEFSAHLKSELEKWGRVIRERRMRVE
ncbi:MAG TPA: tripartite tricarboxylate transporter substrate binding protein, partial [Burkholderiales bacterium]|nr:tripartite tricarboxylate transporter substrate binding protein [Burkholderiales bacterium]